jgi:hypothetical protein
MGDTVTGRCEAQKIDAHPLIQGGRSQIRSSSLVFQLVRNRLQNNAPIADDERVQTDINIRFCRSGPPMQQDILAIYCLDWIFKTGVGKSLGQGFRRIAHGGVTLQNAMFAEQDDIAGIIALQITLNIAVAPACQMIFEHFNRCTRCHS